MEHSNSPQSLTNSIGLKQMADEFMPRKLAILGLPWDTSENTLRDHFSQYGAVEVAEIMKDRYTGKSRGFGFVTFADSDGAQRALGTSHAIDGRVCEAKIAVPKVDSLPLRTTRIVVSQVPLSMSEVDLRAYFQKYGVIQGVQISKEQNKMGFKGTGFVTFASTDSVERVMTTKHWINGHEVAVDRALVKDEPSNFALPSHAVAGRNSFDNGSQMSSSNQTSVLNIGPNLLSNFKSMAIADPFNRVRSLSEDRQMSSVNRSPLDILTGGHALRPFNYGAFEYGNQVPMTQATIQNLSRNLSGTSGLQPFVNSMADSQLLNSMGHLHHSSLASSHSLASDLNANLLSPGTLVGASAAAQLQQQLMAAASVAGRRSFENASAVLKRLENPVIACARAGPRIFVGKLTKDTTEADLKEYFTKFGYVMDVYLPKSKDNKLEHRGFGFITFETDAAIQRVVSHGTHRLKGSTIAVDIAMPKVEDDTLAPSAIISNSSPFQTQMSLASPSQRT